MVEALLAPAAFWLARGVDGFRLDAIDFLLHDPRLRDNPAAPPADGVRSGQAFGLQQHVHDMLQPGSRTVEALRELAGPLSGGTALLGEVSSQDGAYERIDRYTRRGDALHMAYTLAPAARRLRPRGHSTGARRNRRGGEGLVSAGPSATTMSSARPPVGTRPAPRRADPRFARLLHGGAAGLRGSVCMYQGEELGLSEAELALRICAIRLASPTSGIPRPRRQPHADPWRADADHAGFTPVKPWLPVPEDHRAASVAVQEQNARSALHAWRDLAAWRKAHPALQEGDLTPLDLPAPLLGFTRVCAEESLVLVFNPSAHAARVSLKDHPGVTHRSTMPEFAALLDGDVIAAAALRRLRRCARRGSRDPAATAAVAI